MMLLRSLIGLVPWQAWAASGILLAGGVYHWRATDAAYEAGRRDALASISRAADKGRALADEAERAWRNCPAEKRNRETFTCAP